MRFFRRKAGGRQQPNQPPKEPNLQTANSTESESSLSDTDISQSNQSAGYITSKAMQQNSNRRCDDTMASADKEMEERAKRAKELLSQRYKGLRHEQVSLITVYANTKVE